MKKDELLSYIKSFAHGGVITKQEILDAYESGKDANFVKKEMTIKAKSLDVATILYYIGGVVVVLGIMILISTHWAALDSTARIVVTLGSGLLCFCGGSALLYPSKQSASGVYRPTRNRAVIATVFHAIAIVLLPIGLVVTLNTAGGILNTAWWQILVSGILLIIYTSALHFLKRPFFVVATAIFATSFFYALTEYMVMSGFNVTNIYPYITLVIGCAYVLIGHGLTYSTYKKVQGFFYSLGSLAVLSSAFYLGVTGLSMSNILWNWIFPLFLAAALFGSVYLKSRSVLAFGVIFLILYVFKITDEYFSNSVGWPLALVLTGFALIGIGALAVYLSKRIQLTL